MRFPRAPRYRLLTVSLTARTTTTKTMGQILPLWVTSLVLAHMIGAVLLLYALEKVSGILSRPARRVRAALKSRSPDGEAGAAADGAGAPSPAAKGAAARAARRAATLRATTLGADDDFGAGPPATPRHLAPRWSRACACKVRLEGRRG